MGRLQKIRTSVKPRKKLIAKIALLLLVIALCFVPVLFVKNIIGYLPLAMVLVMLLLSFVYVRIMKHVITMDETTNLGNCKRGSRIDYVIKLKNRSPLLLSRIEAVFYVRDMLGGDERQQLRTANLLPFEEREFKLAIRFDHIGEYTAGLKRVEVFDLLGFFSYSFENTVQYPVVVSPQIFDISKLSVANETTSDSRRLLVSVINDGMDYAGSREYALGDPMKSIHWKLSARTHSLMTRLYETPINPSLSIIIDSFSPQYDKETMLFNFDAIVEAGFSLSAYARANDIDCDLRFLDRSGHYRCVEAPDASGYPGIVRDIAPISFEEGAGKSIELIEIAARGARTASTVAVCTSALSNELIGELISLQSRGKKPIVLAVLPEGLDPKTRKEMMKPLNRTRASGISFVVFAHAEELTGGRL